MTAVTTRELIAVLADQMDVNQREVGFDVRVWAEKMDEELAQDIDRYFAFIEEARN